MTSSLSSSRCFSSGGSAPWTGLSQRSPLPDGDEYTLNTLPQSGQRPTTGQAHHQRLFVDLHQHDRVDRLAEVGQQLVERTRLRDVARIAVEDEALRGVRAAEPLADQAEHDVVGHQLAGVHRRLGALAEFGAARDGVAQQVAGRNLGDALLVTQALGLSALAGAGCA